jgi:2-polyprenylphenol 6-hydroxylase
MIYDIAIVGAGPVAISLGLRLGAAGFRTALVGPALEAQAPLHAEHYDPRVFALSAASVEFLEQSRLWAGVDTARVAQIRQMQVSNPRGQWLGLTEDHAPAAADGAQRPLASMVEQTNLLQAAANAMKFAALTQVPGLAQELEISQDVACVRTAEGREIQARLVVGADGANSMVREAAGITVSRSEYRQSALVANFVSKSSACAALEAGTAYQWFTGNAVLALLPLPSALGEGRRFSIVWSCTPEVAQALQFEESLLLAKLQAEIALHDPALAAVLSGFELESAVASFPLALQMAQSMVSSRVALVGDAAHVVHPLAGQGMNLGFGDAAALFATVSQREPLRDLGDEVLLRRYARQRAPAIQAMRLTTDGLAKVFDQELSARHPVGAALRDAGWRAIESLPWIKKQMLTHAMR